MPAVKQFTRNDEGSLQLFLLLLIIMMALVTAVVAVVMTGITKSTASANLIHARAAADTAMASALEYANTHTKLDIDNTPRNEDAAEASPASGYAAGSMDTPLGAPATWVWWIDPLVASDGGGVTGTLHARGRIDSAQGDSEVRLQAELTGSRVQGASGEAGNLIYTLAPSATFNHAITTVGPLLLDGVGGTHPISAYNSTTGSDVDGEGLVASLDRISVLSTTDADKVVLWDGAKRPFLDRCQGPLCSSPDTVKVFPDAVRATGPTANQFIIDKFAACNGDAGLQAQHWVQSASAGNPLQDGRCYKSLTFDVGSYVQTSPARVFVSGPVTVAAGVSVNFPTSTTTPAAANLQIYSYPGANAGTPDPRVPVTINGGTTTPTKVAWMLWAPHSTCGANNSSSGTGAGVWLYGSSTCYTFTAATNQWRIRHDTAARTVADITGASSLIWSTSNARAE